MRNPVSFGGAPSCASKAPSGKASCPPRSARIIKAPHLPTPILRAPTAVPSGQERALTQTTGEAGRVHPCGIHARKRYLVTQPRPSQTGNQHTGHSEGPFFTGHPGGAHAEKRGIQDRRNAFARQERLEMRQE